MKTSVRRFLWVSGALLAMFIGAALAVPFLVDINQYHDLIESQAEKALGREITLGRMRLTLLPLPGVTIEPVAISTDRRGDPPLLRTASLSAHARLFPLLRGKIAVASLVAYRSELNLRRYPDGRWNLPEPPAPTTVAPGQRTEQASGEAFSLSRLRIKSARLRLIDEAVLPGRTVTTVLSDVNLSLDGYAAGRPVGVRLETDLPPHGSGFLSLSGIVALPPDRPGASSGSTDLTLSLKKLRPSTFAPYIRAFAGLDPPLGSISGDLQARGRIRTAADGTWELGGNGELRGKIEMRGVALRSTAAGVRPTPAGDLNLAIDLILSEGGKQIAFRKLEAVTGKTRLAADGILQLGEKTARIDVTVRPSQVMAGDLSTVAAVLGARFPAGFTSAAPISFRGSVSGPLDRPDQMRYRGEIALSAVRYADPVLGRPIEDARGKLTFENGLAKVSGFSARVGETKVSGGLRISDFGAPRIDLALSSPRANLDDLLALLTPSGPSPTASSPAVSPQGDILARTRGTGRIRIDEGSFGTFRFSRFDGNLVLEGKVVTFDPVTFQLYGGTYRGSLSADLRGAEPRYSYRSRLASVNAQQFLGENLGIKNLLAGAVSADLTLDGGGSDLNRIVNSLRGSGSIRVEKGWIGELNVLKGLTRASDLLGERTLAKVSGEIAKSRTDFSALTAELEISQGRVTSRNLKVLSRDLDLDGKGSFTLAGMLDLQLKVLFSRELTEAMLQEGSRARYLDREDDRIVLPLTIRGPLAAPTYGVDLQAITRAAARTEAAQRLSKSGSPLGQLVGSLLGGRPRTEPPGGDSTARPATPSPEAPPAGVIGDASIRITSRKYGGSLLLPDLTIRGEFSGQGLTRADLKVEGKGGRTILEKTDAFREITAYYAVHDPSQPARIPFKTKIDGKKLAGAGDLSITITLHRSDGTTSVQTFTEEKRGF